MDYEEDEVEVMDNEQGPDWINFFHCEGEKSNWLINRLRETGVTIRTISGFQGTHFYVERDNLETVFDLLNQVIGELYLGRITKITYMDLPDNHDIFAEENTEHLNNIKTVEQVAEKTVVRLPNGPVLYMQKIESSLLELIGFEANLSNDLIVYAKFLSSEHFYSYFLKSKDDFVALQESAYLNGSSVEVPLSLGQLFVRLVKTPADLGKIACYKFDRGAWLSVPTKAERQAAKI